MYPDDGGADVVAPMGGAVRRFNLEGLVPLILLVIIGIASLNYFGVIDVPLLPKEVPICKCFLLESFSV